MIGGNSVNNKVTDIGTPLAELASKYVAALRAQAREAMPWAVSVTCLPEVIKVRPGQARHPVPLRQSFCR